MSDEQQEQDEVEQQYDFTHLQKQGEQSNEFGDKQPEDAVDDEDEGSPSASDE